MVCEFAIVGCYIWRSNGYFWRSSLGMGVKKPAEVGCVECGVLVHVFGDQVGDAYQCRANCAHRNQCHFDLMPMLKIYVQYFSLFNNS